MKNNSEESTTCYASIDVKNNKLNAKESDVNYTSIVFGKKRVVKEILNDTNYASVSCGKSKASDNTSKNDSLSISCDKSDVPNTNKATTACDNKKIPDNAPILPPRRENGDKAFKKIHLPQKHNLQCQTDFTNRNQKLFLILVFCCVITGVINFIIWMPGVWINYDEEKPLNRCMHIGKGNSFLTTDKPNDANKVHKEMIVTNPAFTGVTRRMIYEEFEVIGCFKDRVFRDLNVWPWGNIIPHFSMTYERCAAKCKTMGHLYAGLQTAGYCACGDTYGKYGTSTGCNMRCTGDGTQICGNTFRNTILKLKDGYTQLQN